jgi:hypothetical protein
MCCPPEGLWDDAFLSHRHAFANVGHPSNSRLFVEKKPSNEGHGFSRAVNSLALDGFSR